MELPANTDRAVDTSGPGGLEHGFMSSGSRMPAGPIPEQKTAKQIVTELGLRRGVVIRCKDGIERSVRKITGNGDVFVRGMRDRIDVQALRER